MRLIRPNRTTKQVVDHPIRYAVLFVVTGVVAGIVVGVRSGFWVGIGLWLAVGVVLPVVAYLVWRQGGPGTRWYERHRTDRSDTSWW